MKRAVQSCKYSPGSVPLLESLSGSDPSEVQPEVQFATSQSLELQSEIITTFFFSFFVTNPLKWKSLWEVRGQRAECSDRYIPVTWSTNQSQTRHGRRNSHTSAENKSLASVNTLWALRLMSSEHTHTHTHSVWLLSSLSSPCSSFVPPQRVAVKVSILTFASISWCEVTAAHRRSLGKNISLPLTSL